MLGLTKYQRKRIQKLTKWLGWPCPTIGQENPIHGSANHPKHRVVACISCPIYEQLDGPNLGLHQIRETPIRLVKGQEGQSQVIHIHYLEWRTVWKGVFPTQPKVPRLRGRNVRVTRNPRRSLWKPFRSVITGRVGGLSRVFLADHAEGSRRDRSKVWQMPAVWKCAACSNRAPDEYLILLTILNMRDQHRWSTATR